MDAIINRIKNLGRKPRIAVLTGDKLSEESGLDEKPDIPKEEFDSNPTAVYQILNHRRRQAFKCEPNEAHKALLELESILLDDFYLFTTSTDDLQERAGSKRMMYLHGSLNNARCTRCHAGYYWYDDLSEADTCSDCGGILRHNIVLGGEPFFGVPLASVLTIKCDFLLVVGGSKHPLDKFLCNAKSAGVFVVGMGIDAKKCNDYDLFIEGKISEAVPLFVKSLKATLG